MRKINPIKTKESGMVDHAFALLSSQEAESEDHHEFNISLGCAVNSRPALARDL